MKSIVVKADNIHCIDSKLISSSNVHITGISYSENYADLLLITNTGILLSFSILSATFRFSYSLNTPLSNHCCSWFDIHFNRFLSSAVCLSYDGDIVEVKSQAKHACNEGTSIKVVAKQLIEGGFSSASWTADSSHLLIITNGDCILLLSSSLIVVKQLNIASRVLNSQSSVSWRGDGEFFSLVSTDVEDNVTRVRTFDKDLSFIAMGHGSGDCSFTSSLGGLGNEVTAYATSGNYVAVTQKRSKNLLQVLFLDGKGVSVDHFDIQTPALPAGFEEWKVDQLQWDKHSALIAVCFHAECKVTANEKAKRTRPPSFVHLYFRNTYYWYLKHQWEGDSLRFLGFDSEVVNRLYLSQTMISTMQQSDCLDSVIITPAVRIIDIEWEITNSLSSAALKDFTLNKEIEMKENMRVKNELEGVNTLTSDAIARENDWFNHLATQKISADEKAQRCRDRNRIDARNTRQRKKKQMEELLLKVQELKAEREALFKQLPASTTEHTDIASILMSLASTSTTTSPAITVESTSYIGGADREQGNGTGKRSRPSEEGDGFDPSSGDDEGGDNDTVIDDLVILSKLSACTDTVATIESESVSSETDCNRKLSSIKGMANSKELAETRRKERNKIHARKARLRKKGVMQDITVTIAELEEDIRIAKLQLQHHVVV